MMHTKGKHGGTAVEAVWAACAAITGNEGAPLDVDANLFDIGLDSLGLAELVIQLEETYGEGVISIDHVIANPVVGEIAARLPGGAVSPKPDTMPKKLITADGGASPTDGKTAPPGAIFLFAGEGAHSANTDLSVLKTSPSYSAVDKALLAQHGLSAEDFLMKYMGNHAPLHSPVVTTALNILQADLWILWGCARPCPISTLGARPSISLPTRARRRPHSCQHAHEIP